LLRECDEIIHRETQGEVAADNQRENMGRGHREKKAKQLLTNESSDEVFIMTSNSTLCLCHSSLECCQN